MENDLIIATLIYWTITQKIFLHTSLSAVEFAFLSRVLADLANGIFESMTPGGAFKALPQLGLVLFLLFAIRHAEQAWAVSGPRRGDVEQT